MSTLRVTELPVLDLTDPHVQRTLGINKRNLIRNRPAVCRRIADLVRQAPDRFGGLLAPSAANPNERTLVVFREWIPDHVVVTHSRVGAPPMRLIGLLQRVLETLPLTVQDRARWLLAELRRRS